MNDLISLSQLFNEKIFRIPDYQRGYAWTNSQLDDFWDDLDNLTEDRFHYTGMLSLRKFDNNDLAELKEENWIIKDKGYSAYHIVDGQQRLTTFVIFISSIIRFAKSKDIDYLNGDSLEAIKEKYIVEKKKPDNILKAYKFGYEVDNPSFQYLRYNVLEEENSGSLQESFYTLNLENAKKYFDEKLPIYYEEKGKEGLEFLFRKLVTKLQFNIHDIRDDFDVFIAFETMNNRGKKLSNLEILKNRLIYLTTIYPDSILSKDAKAELRREINDTWKEVYYELGRNKDKPLNDDEYLRNHWSLFFKYSRTTGDDYIRFLLDEYFTTKAVYGLIRPVLKLLDEEIDYDEDENPLYIVDSTDGKLTPTEIKQYIDNLKSVAQYWYYSFNPSQSSSFTKEEIEWIEKLNRVGINYFRTLIVASFINPNVTSEKRIELFKVIEKSIFVYFRMAKWQASYQSTVSYNFARELMKNEKSVDYIIDELEKKFRTESAYAVKNFMTKMQGLFNNGNGFYSWSDLRYFLFEYEISLYDKTHVPLLTNWKSFTANEKDKISIEHIFPQTPTKYYWKNNFRDYTAEEQARFANSLGNLLALSQSINSSLQNDEFEQKKNPSKGRRGYSDGSHSEREVSNYHDWTPETIKERGLHLLKFMESRWDISFKEEDKLSILGIDFINDDRVHKPDLLKVTADLLNSERGNNEGVMKVSDYFEDKNPFCVETVILIYTKLKGKINGLYSVAKNPYVAFKDVNKRNVAEIRVFKTEIKVNIHKPKNEELQFGFSNPKSYRWVLDYYLKLKEEEPFDIEKVVDAIMDSYNQL